MILCPNCHKLFDYGNREKEKRTKDSYSVIINGKKYKASGFEKAGYRIRCKGILGKMQKTSKQKGRLEPYD